MSTASKHVPADIVADILTRLPLKSLVRFKCVSKPWYNFITHSKFPYWLLYRHLHCNSIKDCPHNDNSIFLLYDPTKTILRPRRFREHDEDAQIKSCRLFAFGGGALEDSFRSASEIDFPLFREKSFEIKTGACHGMFCLSISDGDNPDATLVLWNPSIHDYKILPLPQVSGICAGVCGLGFDPNTEDYKVVSVCDKQAYVFSVKMNLWKHVGEFSYTLFHEPIPLHGCLYWAASTVNKLADRLLCFKLCDQTFREIPSPPFQPIIPQSLWFYEQLVEERFVVVTELNVLAKGDSLCVFRQYDQTLWIMKLETEGNAGSAGGSVKMSWTKLMTIPKIINQEANFRIHYRLHPKCFTKSGKLIISLRRMWFVMYDGEEFEDLEVEGLGDERFHKAVVYSESLISPRSIRG